MASGKKKSGSAGRKRIHPGKNRATAAKRTSAGEPQNGSNGAQNDAHVVVPSTSADDFRHSQLARQRPDVGIQEQFTQKKPPKTYRYDSSLDPQLSWDENRDRDLAEWLLGLIEAAAEKGEQHVFVTPQEWKGGGVRIESTRSAAYLLKQLTKPFLNWAGKAERHQISVPTVPLFVHERHSTKAILDGIRHRSAPGTNLALSFADPQMDVGERLDAYRYPGPWQNRMILGDSLHVMNSMLEFEGLGGQVQMIYFDPPYGVKYGTNFQPFVRNRSADSSNKDVDISRDPEMVKAYRDTWELGIHSYLTYLRDRLFVARELLDPSGSVFVQISDTNSHLARQILDEVLGPEQFCGQIAFRTTGGQSSTLLSSSTDYLLWYARDRTQVKFRRPYASKLGGTGDGSGQYTLVEPVDFSSPPRAMSSGEAAGTEPIPVGWRVLAHDTLYSQGASKDPEERRFTWEGRVFECPANTHWKPGVKSGGMQALANARRLMLVGNTLRYKRYLSDFPVYPIDNVWNDTARSGFGRKKQYVVETDDKVVERCLLMTTDPGDLVFDPTCGSGTTAYVSERWGRRWITCDTSRVPLALARQQLLTATFPYYELKDPKQGPIGGFVYKRRQNRKGEEVGGVIPHITLGSIANNQPAGTETLVDRPEEVPSVTRVSGPFVVEASIAPAQSVDLDFDNEPVLASGLGEASTHVERMTQVLKQSKTLRLQENRTLVLEGVRRLDDAEHLHAEAVQPESGQKAAIVFGPEDGAISSDIVYEAASEAYFLKYSHLYFFGFAIQAKARELLGDRKKLRIPCSYVAVTPDVGMSDLLKTSRASEIFSVTGLPEVEVIASGKKSASGDPLYQVTLKGVDVFDPETLKHTPINRDSVPAWMLDTDYDGLSFHAAQVFFPKTLAWDNIQKSLRATFDESVWAHLAGTTSEPFILGKRRRIAVRVIDERGNELMRVVDVR